MKQSIKYLNNKIKLVGDFFNKTDIFLVSLIILSCFASFGLGRLSKINEDTTPLQIASTSLIKQTEAVKGKYVASVNGTKYHFPWCSGAQRIKDSNKIWFDTREEAENRGYTPASNCKGI